MSVSSSVPTTVGRRVTVRKLATYVGGSVVAAGCSELALVVCYGLIGWSTGVSSVVAWVAGAVPNYWLNRSWTWRQRGRPSLRREVLPYVAIILATLLLAIGATHLVAALLHDSSEAGRTTAVAVTFFGVYVAMFLVRYFLLDRLFGRLPAPHPTSSTHPDTPEGDT